MTKDLIVRFNPEVHTKFKIICVAKGETMNDVIRQLVRDYIAKHNTKVA